MQSGGGRTGRGRVETGIGLDVWFLLCTIVGKVHEVAVGKRAVLCRAVHRTRGPAVEVRVVEVVNEKKSEGGGSGRD